MRRTVTSILTSELHSETGKRNRRILYDLIHNNLGYSETISAVPKAREYVPYSDGVDPYSTQFPNDNNPIMPDSTAFFEKLVTDQWILSELNMTQRELL